MNLLQAWEKTKEVVRQRISPAAYEAWISRLGAQENKEGILTLSVPDDFFKAWVCSHYLVLMEDTLGQFCQRKVEIEFRVKPEEDVPQPKKEAAPITGKTAPASNLNPRYTFDNFIVGPSNRFSHAASLAVAESPAKVYNPLFIYGGVGLGKTHLMQAICHQILEKSATNKLICYLPSEKFTNELINAIQHHATARFRQKYRNADILVVDDVHFIAGKESTQEEFFHTFNTLYDAHKQIIISSDRNPKDIPNLEERLVSRFGWGLVTDIQPPDFETRVAILKKKVEREPVSVSDDVLFFIAQLVQSNIRELEGALIRVVAYSLLENKPIDTELAQAVLKDFARENTKNVTIDMVQKEVAAFFNLPAQDIKGKKRVKNIVLARQVAMYLAREMTCLSLPEIGGYFSGKDHTTVLHSCKKIKGLLIKDKKVKKDVEDIINIIKK